MPRVRVTASAREKDGHGKERQTMNEVLKLVKPVNKQLRFDLCLIASLMTDAADTTCVMLHNNVLTLMFKSLGSVTF